MTTWYTADPHFGHDNIRRLCDRPFSSLSEMHGALLGALQACVQPDDDLWVIGDFAYGRGSAEMIRPIFAAIPGRKHLIVGNHDGPATLALPWASVAHLAEIEDEGQRLTLCHYPMITWNHARRGALQLFGHVHNNWPGTRNSVNVGVDLWDFRPVRLAEIRARASTLPVNAHWSEAEPGAAL